MPAYRRPIMPLIVFPYHAVALGRSGAFPGGHTVFRPAITATLRLGDFRTDPFLGLVDSGADYCFFPPEFASRLGLDYKALPSEAAYGLGEDQQVRFGAVTLEVDGLGTWEVYAGFSESCSGRTFGLLGQLGFFDRFKITLDANPQDI